MSAPERVMADARILDHNAVGLLANPNNPGSAANRQFIRRFVAELPQSEQGTLVDTRLRNAVLAKAHGDAARRPILHWRAFSPLTALPSCERVRDRLHVVIGRLRDADQQRRHGHTTDLMDAVRRTADIRQRAVKLENYQRDAFDPIPKQVEDFMRMFYDTLMPVGPARFRTSPIWGSA
jgi:hypothetical protein